MQLKGKVAVVSGAGSGIGRELALQLAQKGASVAALDINADTVEATATDIRAKGGRSTGFVTDISDKDRVYAIPKEVEEALGPTDLLINNAGIIQPFWTVSALSFDQIERVLNINLYGTLYMIKAFLPTLRNRPEGHIVNLASMGAYAPVPGQTIYGASKAAIEMLSEGLMSELHHTSVNVSVVFPGAIETNIVDNAPDITDQDVKEMMDNADASASQNATSAAEAAKVILAGIERNRKRIFIGNDSKFMNTLSRINPQWASNLIRSQLEKAIGSVKDD